MVGLKGDPLLIGAAVAGAAALFDPSPIRKVGEAALALGLLAYRFRGLGQRVRQTADDLGLNAENPLIQPGGGEYVATWVQGIPGDVTRYFQQAPPQRKPGQSTEELNRESLAWLWATSK